jgi:hypothetical protein
MLNGKKALFKNYHKMLNSGTWSAPILRSLVPSTKTVLPPHVTFKVKTTDVDNTYERFLSRANSKFLLAF